MILFPQPRNLIFSEGETVYPMKTEDRDLVSFFRKVRQGETSVSPIRTGSLPVQKAVWHPLPAMLFRRTSDRSFHPPQDV